MRATLWLALPMMALVACHSDTSGVGKQAVCNTHFDYESDPASGWSSPAAGTLTLTGVFYPDETVELEYVDHQGGMHHFSGTPPSQRETLTLTNLPSGANDFIVSVSCAGGRDDHYANGTFTIK
ncbi:MAG TPA: hypothetical protein VID74_01395 [Gemmatimonadales bacterium]|jgi:hypothetical protein